MSKHSFFLELRGQTVQIEYDMVSLSTLQPFPQNDVDEYVILDESGEYELNWSADVTLEEEELIMKNCHEHYNNLTESEEDHH